MSNRDDEALHEGSRALHVAHLHAEHLVHLPLHLASGTQLAIGLQALLLLDGQFGACRPAVGDVRAIDVPPGLHTALESNLTQQVPDISSEEKAHFSLSVSKALLDQ